MMDHPIKQLRKAVGLSQAAFAASVGITEGRICHIEKGRGSPGGKTLLRISEAYRAEMVGLGITAEDLIRGSRSRAA